MRGAQRRSNPGSPGHGLPRYARDDDQEVRNDGQRCARNDKRFVILDLIRNLRIVEVDKPAALRA